MLPDLSYFNLILENLGTSLENVLNLTNLIINHDNTQTFSAINNYVNLLHLWPTTEEYTVIAADVLWVIYLSPSYWEALRVILTEMPSLSALDYLHAFYIHKVVYITFLQLYCHSYLNVTKPIVFSTQLDIFFLSFLNKWTYAIIMFGLTYFLTNVMRFRYQYGFNFYFNYFKILSDLGEQEYGAYDDFKFFLFILAQTLMWYCWVFFIGYIFSWQSETKLILLTLSVMISILMIPIRLIWDFGLSFGMYIRGAASSSNLIIEIFFDIIGIVIIFTRFIVQNIRFLMVFIAFFEIFEWSFSSVDVNYILQFNLNVVKAINLHANLNFGNLVAFVVISLKISIIYLYHLLHLIIVSFMQIGVYLMVSFWLFFFLYTSFFKMTTDSYFQNKRNLNVC